MARALPHGGPDRYGGVGSCGDHLVEGKQREIHQMLESLAKYTMYVLC
jgi:hypothetical protein